MMAPLFQPWPRQVRNKHGQHSGTGRGPQGQKGVQVPGQRLSASPGIPRFPSRFPSRFPCSAARTAQIISELHESLSRSRLDSTRLGPQLGQKDISSIHNFGLFMFAGCDAPNATRCRNQHPCNIPLSPSESASNMILERQI
ncbi:hypothetical protein ACLKA7_004393 [Drosophila subpalustris]